MATFAGKLGVMTLQLLDGLAVQVDGMRVMDSADDRFVK